MRIVLGSDHRGKDMCTWIANYLGRTEHKVRLIACEAGQPVDYPDVAAETANDVMSGQADRGILICGTGIGVCIVANKFPGVRAAQCQNEVVAELSRRHNNSNVLCLSGDMLGEKATLAIVEKWLSTDFDGGRHTERLNKIAKLEQRDRVKPSQV